MWRADQFKTLVVARPSRFPLKQKRTHQYYPLCASAPGRSWSFAFHDGGMSSLPLSRTGWSGSQRADVSWVVDVACVPIVSPACVPKRPPADKLGFRKRRIECVH